MSSQKLSVVASGLQLAGSVDANSPAGRLAHAFRGASGLHSYAIMPCACLWCGGLVVLQAEAHSTSRSV